MTEGSSLRSGRGVPKPGRRPAKVHLPSPPRRLVQRAHLTEQLCSEGGRSYGHPLGCARAVRGRDDSDKTGVPTDVIATISTRITSEVCGQDRVFSTSRTPPGIIEW